MLQILIVEDNPKLRPALHQGLEATGQVRVVGACASGEEALQLVWAEPPDVILMDVQLQGERNGIETAVAVRREYPRMPVVFYSIQDDDQYFRDFLDAGILSHYAYVRKSNYLLPSMVLPLLKMATSGQSYIDPDIETRVQAVRLKDQQDPLALLEPNEREVAHMLAAGMSNRQIASRMGFRDKRTISRINGQIYTAWGLNDTSTDEKVARTRVAIILHSGRLMRWDEDGNPYVLDARGGWTRWQATP